MAKRRVSIRGRGAEILFGEPPAVDIEPRLPGDPEAESAGMASPIEAPGLAPGELDDAVERALFEEARDGAPQPRGAQAVSLARDKDVLSDPEIEAAMTEEAFAAEEPPEPVAEAPAPTMEETMVERDLAEEAALYEPPPPEVDDVSAGVLPPRPPRPSLELFQDQTLARDIQEPATPVKPLELPVLNVTEEERQAILKWWGDRRIRELSTDIDATYEEVRRKVGENESIATDAFNQLLKARDILIRRDAERIAQAEYYIEQVRVRLKRASESESAAKKVQWPLLGWGLFWGVIFLALLIMAGMDWFQGLFQPASQAQSLVELDVFLSAMLWGGIGGAVAVLYSLFKHIGMRDFDSQYVISYVGKPFLGLIVGATVYMILALVVRALGIVPASQATGEVETIPAIAPGVVYLVAWAAGFKENRLLELVDRVMKQVFGSSDKEEPSSEPAVPTG